MSLKLHVVIASTRPGRVGPTIGKWAAEQTRLLNRFDVEVVDLAEQGLPLLDEPAHPRAQRYTQEHTKKWSTTIAAADAFLFVVPEYDYFPNAALVNALQFLSIEWEYKAAAVVSYGGVSGGLRSAQVLRSLLGNLNVMAIPQAVVVPFYPKFINDEQVFKPDAPLVDSLNLAIDELAKWASAAKRIREAA